MRSSEQCANLVSQSLQVGLGLSLPAMAVVKRRATVRVPRMAVKQRWYMVEDFALRGHLIVEM